MEQIFFKEIQIIWVGEKSVKLGDCCVIMITYTLLTT